MESGKTIALAGIIATAIVGIVGAGSSWLISRDDRSNQRALAHETRVYDRRADAYIDALVILLRLDRELKEGKSASEVALLVRETDVQEAKIRAYASDDAWRAFSSAANLAFEAARSEERIKRFGVASLRFQAIVRREVH